MVRILREMLEFDGRLVSGTGKDCRNKKSHPFTTFCKVAPKCTNRKIPPKGKERMNDATRQREQRLKRLTRVQELEDSEWGYAECMLVLNRKAWRGTVFAKLALRRLAQLHGFM